MRGANTMLPGKLLDAAEAVVVRQGISNLTLDAVAAEAGMSKGGLLHHFRTKDRLVEALVVRSAENWRACYLEALRAHPGRTGAHGAGAPELLPFGRPRLDGPASAQLVRCVCGSRTEPFPDRAHACGLQRPPSAHR